MRDEGNDILGIIRLVMPDKPDGKETVLSETRIMNKMR
jgi:hypothetical protein